MTNFYRAGGHGPIGPLPLDPLLPPLIVIHSRGKNPRLPRRYVVFTTSDVYLWQLVNYTYIITLRWLDYVAIESISVTLLLLITALINLVYYIKHQCDTWFFISLNILSVRI